VNTRRENTFAYCSERVRVSNYDTLKLSPFRAGSVYRPQGATFRSGVTRAFAAANPKYIGCSCGQSPMRDMLGKSERHLVGEAFYFPVLTARIVPGRSLIELRL
jgi:hypothetical protein